MNTYNNILAPRTVPFVTLLFARPFWPNAMQINLNTKWDTVFHKKKDLVGGNPLEPGFVQLENAEDIQSQGVYDIKQFTEKIGKFCHLRIFFSKINQQIPLILKIENLPVLYSRSLTSYFLSVVEQNACQFLPFFLHIIRIVILLETTARFNMAESAESKSVNYEELIGEEEIPLLRNISEIKNLTSSILAATTSYREVQFLFVYHIYSMF